MSTSQTNLEQALREVLAPEPAPASLKDALLSQARVHDQGRRKSPWFLRTATAAAALLLFAGGGVFLVGSRSAKEPTHIAQEALRNFMEVHALEFQGEPACGQACTQWSKKMLGFDAPLPSCCTDLKVVGGRACRVDGRAVAHFLLSDGRALYVFQKPLTGGTAEPGAALAVAGGLQAKAWNEQGRGYVLVEAPQGR